MKDPKKRFSETVQAYRANRPGYPESAVSWIARTAGLRRGDRIADVGCGTGISTRLLGKRGFRVVGIDPNLPMLGAARAEGGARYQQGEASRTGLRASSLALVTAFQAMHWFALGPTLREWKRILRPGGWACAVWNVRKKTPFLTAYDRLLRKHSREYRSLQEKGSVPRLRTRREVGTFRSAVFPNRQTHTKKGLFGRAYSSSYVVHGIRDHPAFDEGLSRLFDRFQERGRVEFLYDTRVYAFRLDRRRPSPRAA